MRMLEKDPNKRISMNEIFEHPWVDNYRFDKRQLEWGQMF